MRRTLIVVLLAGLVYIGYRWWTAAPQAPADAHPPAVDAFPEAEKATAPSEKPPPSPAPSIPSPDPARVAVLLQEGRAALAADEARGVALLNQVLDQDPRGPLGQEAAEALLPVVARRGEARRELTLRWRLGQMDADGWKRLEDLNAPLFARDRASKDPETVFYVVQPGDSLEKIAKNHGSTVSLIQRLNGRDAGNTTIHPGNRFKILPVKERVTVEVRKSEFAAYLLYDGNLLRKYRVGIGTGDLTPEGEFRIATRLTNPDWWKDGKMIPHGDPENILGTHWLGFAEPYRTYAIHGTTMPETLGKKASNGCVRMDNRDVEELYAFCPAGTRVVILP